MMKFLKGFGNYFTFTLKFLLLILMVLLYGYESENFLLGVGIFLVLFGFGEWNIIARELHPFLDERPGLNPLTASD
jgi:hypothetical protein